MTTEIIIIFAIILIYTLIISYIIYTSHKSITEYKELARKNDDAFAEQCTVIDDLMTKNANSITEIINTSDNMCREYDQCKESLSKSEYLNNILSLKYDLLTQSFFIHDWNSFINPQDDIEWRISWYEAVYSIVSDIMSNKNNIYVDTHILKDIYIDSFVDDGCLYIPNGYFGQYMIKLINNYVNNITDKVLITNAMAAMRFFLKESGDPDIKRLKLDLASDNILNITSNIFATTIKNKKHYTVINLQ